MAKERGYVLRASKGKVQFVTVVYDKKGNSTVTPHTDFISYEEAKQIMEEA